MRPQLLLLDEVTSALDPELVGEVLDVIRELAAGGMTMVIATHEMSFAREIAGQVCFLDERRDPRAGPAGPDLLLADAAADARVPRPHHPRRPSVGGRYRFGMAVEHQHLDVSIEPLDEYLVIQPTSDETETRAGLILPASAAAAAAVRTGIVTAVGTEASGVEPGDKVLYPREEGFDVRLGGIEVKVIKREALIARIHD